MKNVESNPTVDGYRGSIGRLVFEKYGGCLIVAGRAVHTKPSSEAELGRRYARSQPLDSSI